MEVFRKKVEKSFVSSEKSSTFALAKKQGWFSGALVQLVRMPACHAGGHGSESRTHRFLDSINSTLVR